MRVNEENFAAGNEEDVEPSYVDQVIYGHNVSDEAHPVIRKLISDTQAFYQSVKNSVQGVAEAAKESAQEVENASEEAKKAVTDAAKSAENAKMYAKSAERAQAGRYGTGENSFIANDIETNKALSLNSTAMGGKATAGGMGYKVTAIQDNGDGTGVYTLQTVEGLTVGMSYSIRLKQGQQCNVGKITAIDTESRTVTVDNYYHMDLDGGADNPEKFTTEDYLTIVGRPDLGDVVVGFNALAAGEGCIASDRDTVAFGRDVKVLGQYGFGAGRNNMVTYGAVSFGMNNKSLGLYSQTFGADLTATGKGQLVTGFNNIKDVEKKYLHIIGNGKNGKSNAYTLDLDGVGWYAGGLKIGGKSQDDGEDVATEKFVKDYIGANGGNSGSGYSPYIGENGNWYSYDEIEQQFINTGVKAEGKTPVKGEDYWTDEDKEEIKAYVDEAILGGAW